MNLLADENIDRQIVARLRKDGHGMLYIAEIAPSVSDDEVLSKANSIQAVLITADKDFGELVYRLGRIHAGVVLLRLAGLSAESKADILSAALRGRGAEMADSFSVVTRASIRIRRRL